MRSKIAAKTARLNMIFDDYFMGLLNSLTTEGHYTSKADVIREALATCYAVRSQMKRGYTELVVRNPETGQERVIVTRLLI